MCIKNNHFQSLFSFVFCVHVQILYYIHLLIIKKKNTKGRQNMLCIKCIPSHHHHFITIIIIMINRYFYVVGFHFFSVFSFFVVVKWNKYFLVKKKGFFFSSDSSIKSFFRFFFSCEKFVMILWERIEKRNIFSFLRTNRICWNIWFLFFDWTSFLFLH